MGINKTYTLEAPVPFILLLEVLYEPTPGMKDFYLFVSAKIDVLGALSIAKVVYLGLSFLI